MPESKEPTPKNSAAKIEAAVERQAASSEELDKAQKEVVVMIKENRFLLRLLIGVVTVCLAVISIAGIIGARTGTEAKKISSQNNQFLDNFANYMRCLIVNEDDVVIAVGEDAYVALCEELLYRDTGKKPNPIIVEIPKDFDPNAPITTTTSP